MQGWVDRHGFTDNNAMLKAAFALSEHYGSAIAALACQMYEATAAAQGVTVNPAEAAATPEYGEVAKAVNGAKKQSEKLVPSTVGRLVKQVGADTTLKNAQRDGAQFAWVPHGDSCAFCLMLASRGWQYMSKKALKNGHAEHIHANCDCQYAVRFDGKSTVEGYDPDTYKKMYDDAEGNTPQEKLNSMRRAMAAEKRAVEKGSGSGIIKSGKGAVTISSIDSPIEQRNTSRGKPGAILHFDVDLNNRQQVLLDSLQEYDSRVTIAKSDANMTDLSALTAKTGDEFAMFTKGGERLIVRGNDVSVNITQDEARELAAAGYTWSGHTHPGANMNVLQPSDGDYAILKQFDQETTSIYNSVGNYITFGEE